jgi:hypothetical protein
MNDLGFRGHCMSVKFSLALAIVIASFGTAQAQAVDSKPRYRLDAAEKRVVELSNLSSGDDCHQAPAAGKVVKRIFDARGVIVQAFTLEADDGARQHVTWSWTRRN